MIGLFARRAEQKFNIAVAAADWRRNNAIDAPAERGDEGCYVAADGRMHGGIADDATFDKRAPGFELRLDQCNELRRFVRQRQSRRRAARSWVKRRATTAGSTATSPC